MLIYPHVQRPTEARRRLEGGVAVIIATRGRPEAAGRVLGRLNAQTHPPRIAVISATGPQDLAELPATPFEVITVFGSAGLTKQRNRGLKELPEGLDAIVFFDDDFLPATDWLERLLFTLQDDDSVGGITGRVVADGANGPGIPTLQGLQILAEAEREPAALTAAAIRTVHSLYGCNMAFRACALNEASFDERLPAYGWQEDQDISGQVCRRFKIVQNDSMLGVHLGEKHGRVSGVRMGISQIINPLYLLRKRTITLRQAARLVLGNVGANALRSLCPEPYVDRSGRLKGNLIAISYLLRGRLDPEVIELHS